MRGIAKVILTTFTALLLFGILAPALLEPIAQFVTSDPTVQQSSIDAQGIADGLKKTILVWGPLLVIGSSIVFAVRWYLNRERFTGRRVR